MFLPRLLLIGVSSGDSATASFFPAFKEAIIDLKPSRALSRFSTISSASTSGSGRLVEVCQTPVFEPGDVEAGFVAGEYLLVGELSPSAVCILLTPGRLPFVPVGGVVAGDEVWRSVSLWYACFFADIS